MKDFPYDNVVVDTTYKVIKIEFLNNQIFETQEQLGYEFSNYVNWYNNHRIHSPQLSIVKIPLKKLFSLMSQSTFLQCIIQLKVKFKLSVDYKRG